MKKKLLWLAALFAAFALVVTGCPTGGGEDPVTKGPSGGGGGGGEFEFWLASDDAGTKLGKDTVKLVGTGDESYVYVFFTPPGVGFDKIKIDYTFGGDEFNMRWQCAYDGSGTWGSVSGDQNYIGLQGAGPSECDPTVMFKQRWSGDASAIDITTMKGICFAVSVGSGVEANFKLLNVELVGLDYKALLKASIAAANALVATEYTADSWTALQTALTSARAVAAKTDATPAEINSAKAALDAAIKALVPAGAVDKTALNALIVTAKTKVETDYTPGSWTVFAAALSAAESASTSTSMGQTAINSAKDELQTAMDALVLRMYVTSFIYTGTTAVTSTVEIDTGKTSPGVTVSSGSIKVPRDTAADNGKGETRLNLLIDPAVDITSYGDITFEWSGHSDSSFNISLVMSGNRMLSKDASGASTKFDFVADLPSWASGWGDAAIGSLSGIEVYSASNTITDLTISKITIAGTPYVPTYPPADDGLTADSTVTLASILTGATGSITNSNTSQTYSANDFVKVGGTTPALRLKPTPGDGKGDFRVEITFNPAIDASAYPNFSFTWLASGGELGATTNSYNVNFDFADGGKIGKYSWMSGRSFAYTISASDLEGGTSITTLNKIEIWVDKSDRITNLYITSIKFEAPAAGTPPTLPVMFDAGLWATTVGNPSVKQGSDAILNQSGGYTIDTTSGWANNEIRFDQMDVSAYSKLIVQFTLTVADPTDGLNYLNGGVYSHDSSGGGMSHNNNYANLLNSSTFVFDFSTMTNPGWDGLTDSFNKATFDGVTFGFEKNAIKITKIWFE